MREKITIMEDNVMVVEVEAIICQANTELEMSEGIPALLLEKGGEEVQRGCNLFEKLKKGEAVITSSGNLMPGGYIIHAIVYSLGEEDDDREEEHLMNAIRKSLSIAKEKDLKKISMPFSPETHSKIPIKRIAELVMAEVKRHMEGETSIEKIFFIAENHVIYDAFEDAYRQL